MRIPPVLGATVLLASLSRTATGDIIVWRDNSGVSHYTNDIANVPSEYKAEAMTVARDWVRARPAAERVPAARPAARSGDTAAAVSRDAYEAAYVAGFRAGSQTDSAGNAANDGGSFLQNADAVPSATMEGDRIVGAPAIPEGHRPRKSDHRDDRE
jgi:hypothetical protein